MIYFSHIPKPPLSDFIDRLWHCSDKPSHSRERILPTGTVELVINLLDNEIRVYDPQQPNRCSRYSGAVASGPYRRCFVIDPLQHASIIGVHFKPGGAFPFLGAPPNELADTHVDLEVLWGQVAAELRERLCAAATPAQRFLLLEDALISRLRRPPVRHAAVTLALESLERGAGPSVRDIARRVGLSHRHFIQVFASEVGLTPKLYCRIRRFQQAGEAVRNLRAPDWAAVALDCGYFDQSHIIRDFQEFSGLSPMAYVKQASDQVLLNHVRQP